MTPRTKDGSIFCRRCDLQLGVLEHDGISIRFGNVRQYGYRVKYFCLCGKAYFFSERDLGGHNTSDFPDATHEILHGLGKDYLTDEDARIVSKQKYRRKFKLDRNEE
jgi:hypothetical protein